MDNLSEKKLMLIGGAGYIGSVTADEFITKGYKIKIYDNLIYNQNDIYKRYEGNKLVELIKGDLRDEELLSESLEDVDHVIMFAGLVGDPITKRYPVLSNSINSEAIENSFSIINRCNIDRFIFISTCSNYGLISDNELATEDFPLNPLSLYAKSKVKCENKLLSLSGKSNFTPTILRFATAFGLSPRMRFDLTVNEFTYHLFKKNELIVYDKDTWRPYCHVSDFSHLIEKVLIADRKDIAFEVFNAGHADNNATKEMLINLITPHTGKNKIIFQGDGADKRNYKVDFKKVEKVLDFIPKYSLEDGILEIVREIEMGLFADYEENMLKYGNYEL